MAERQPAAPTHRVYTVIRREGQDDYWLNIGLAFPHKDGNGFNIVLQALPLDGKIVCREITEEEQTETIRSSARPHRRRPRRPGRAPAMSPEMRRAKLAKLVEIEGFDDENALFAAAISDSVCSGDLLQSGQPGLRLHRRDGAGSGSRLVRDVRARHAGVRPRARRAHLMSRERYVYALSDWTVNAG